MFTDGDDTKRKKEKKKGKERKEELPKAGVVFVAGYVISGSHWVLYRTSQDLAYLSWLLPNSTHSNRKR